MNMSPEAIKLQQEFEGCELKAYPDPKTGGAPWTCGWGCTSGVTEDTEWTQEEADQQHLLVLSDFERLINDNVSVEITQGVFDCMVDIVYNVGPGGPHKDGIIRLKNGNPSTLLRKLNAGDWAGAKDSYDDWVSPGSNVEKGLRRRRKAFLDRFWDM